MIRCIVLGRFQPFHLGHVALVKAAVNHANGGEVVVAIGSSQSGWEAQNPWTFEERQQMITRWAQQEGLELTIVGIADINNPPLWVEHATQLHGNGVLVTSDNPTQALYEASGWTIKEVDYADRVRLEGWRVRQTIRMLSTVDDAEAARSVLADTVPQAVIEWLIENDAMFRCSTFETGVHAG